MTMQAKLLRVLQEREVQRIGGTQPIAINCRVLAATNRDLRQAISEKAFREDLFYRLRVVEVRVPPLRERREDISLLAHYFLDKYRAEFSKDVRRLHPATLSMLEAMDWSGSNVEWSTPYSVRWCSVVQTCRPLKRHRPTSCAPSSHAQGSIEVEIRSTLPRPSTWIDLQAAEGIVRDFTVQYLLQRLREGEGNITKGNTLWNAETRNS